MSQLPSYVRDMYNEAMEHGELASIDPEDFFADTESEARFAQRERRARDDLRRRQTRADMLSGMLSDPALFRALERNDFAAAEIYLAAGSTLQSYGADGYPLAHAVFAGGAPVLQWLRRKGVGVDARRDDGNGFEAPTSRTVLQRAVLERRLDVAQLALKRGAQPDLGSPPPLILAAAWDDGTFTKLLLQHGASPDAVDDPNYPWTALAQAIRQRNLAAARLLADGGANPFRLQNGETLVGVAVNSTVVPREDAASRADTLLFVLDVLKGDANQPSKNGVYPLEDAIRNADADLAMILVQHGASMDAPARRYKNEGDTLADLAIYLSADDHQLQAQFLDVISVSDQHKPRPEPADPSPLLG